MNYLNANIQCFDNTQYLTSNPLTHFTAHVTCSKTKTGQYKVHAFGIILFLNIRGSQCNQTHNPLSRQEKLNFKIRLTKVSEIPEGQLSYDLADFTLDLSDKSLIHKANFNYIDLIKVLNVRHLIINSTGCTSSSAMNLPCNHLSGYVQVFGIFHRHGQLLLDFCLCFTQHILDNALAGGWAITHAYQKNGHRKKGRFFLRRGL